MGRLERSGAVLTLSGTVLLRPGEVAEALALVRSCCRLQGFVASFQGCCWLEGVPVRTPRAAVEALGIWC